MISNQFNDILALVRKALDRNLYSEALAQIATLCQLAHASWDIRDRVNHLGETLGFIKQYAFSGFDDPTRGSQLRKLRSDILDIVARLQFECGLLESGNIYFATLRQRNLEQDNNIISIINDYFALVSKYSLSQFAVNEDDGATKQLSEAMFECENRLFNAIWTTLSLSECESSSLEKLIKSEEISVGTKRLVVSALLLGGMRFHDERKLELLIDSYENCDRTVSIYSLCALLMLLWTNRDKSLSDSMNSRMSILSDDVDFKTDAKIVFRQLIKSRDTERITRKVNEEIIPTMMKFRPDIERFSNGLAEESISFEENPEWAELLHESGIEDQLKELNDMQMEGADVMMSTFSHLKSFPFFHDVANWFRLYDTGSCRLNQDGDMATRQLLEMINHANLLCDSDKYSLAFSLWRMPGDALDMLKSQLSTMSIDFTEGNGGVADEDAVAALSNKYIQDIYRFFNLFRRKSDFENPFTSTVNLYAVDSVASAVNDRETTMLVGEFFFKRGYYKEALEVFKFLPEDDHMFSESSMQKIGYCLQRLGSISEAMEYYEKSELINGRNKWTLKKLGFCHKALGNIDKALEYFNRVLEYQPDDIPTIMAVGYCHVEAERYHDALNAFFKVEFIDSDGESRKTARPIAWCLMMTGDYERSKSYYDSLAHDELSANDFLNIGHLAMASRCYDDAIVNYKKSIEAAGKDLDWLLGQIEKDSAGLAGLGITEDMSCLVIDEISKSPNK